MRFIYDNELKLIQVDLLSFFLNVPYLESRKKPATTKFMKKSEAAVNNISRASLSTPG